MDKHTSSVFALTTLRNIMLFSQDCKFCGEKMDGAHVYMRMCKSAPGGYIEKFDLDDTNGSS